MLRQVCNQRHGLYQSTNQVEHFRIQKSHCQVPAFLYLRRPGVRVYYRQYRTVRV